MRLMCIASVDDAFELRRGEKAVLDEALRQDGTISRHGRRNRGHGRRLNQSCRMFRRAVDVDRLKLIGLIDRVLQRVGGFAPGFRQVFERDCLDVVERVPRAFFGERTGFLASGISQSVQVRAGRPRRDRQG